MNYEVVPIYKQNTANISGYGIVAEAANNVPSQMIAGDDGQLLQFATQLEATTYITDNLGAIGLQDIADLAASVIVLAESAPVNDDNPRTRVQIFVEDFMATLSKDSIDKGVALETDATLVGYGAVLSANVDAAKAFFDALKAIDLYELPEA